MQDFAMMDPLMAPTMDRRGLLQRAMLLLGATALAGCDLLPGSGAPAALGADQLKLLDAYADTLLPATDKPGALQGGVPKVLAQMYADWASAETRDALSGALGRLDAAAKQQTGKAFAELAAADRLTFLTAHDKAALQPVPLAPDAPKGSLFQPVISVADLGYHKLKELVLVLFYASEAGLSSDLSYVHVPGKWQSSIAITPETRPAAAFGIY